MQRATILAQGGVGEALAPICELFGFALCFVFVVAIAVLIARAKERRSKVAPAIAVVGSLTVIILCVAFLESGPTKAWRTFARTHVVQVVDEETGKLLAIQYDSRADLPDDPFIDWGIHTHQPDQLEVRANVDFPLDVWADGYERKTIQLTRSSPNRIVVKLTRATKLPATRGD